MGSGVSNRLSRGFLGSTENRQADRQTGRQTGRQAAGRYKRYDVRYGGGLSYSALWRGTGVAEQVAEQTISHDDDDDDEKVACACLLVSTGCDDG